MNYCSSDIAMYGLVNERSVGKSVDDPRNLRMEFRAEAPSLRFIPKLRLGNVQLSRATDLDFVAQRSSRSSRTFASGQGF